MMRARSARVVTATLVVGLVMTIELASEEAKARPTRPRFEPTDLELEDPGVTELDLQVGATRGNGDGGNRFILPDFEFDLGLLPNVELDLDGAFSIDRYDQPTRRASGEALWTAMKLGLYDSRDEAGTHTFAVGVQLGPRIPTIRQRGIGYAALGLVGVGDHGLHVVLNAGGIMDPGTQITQGQQKSLVTGVDVDLDLDARGIWSLLGEFAAAHYVSPDPDELAATLGVSWSVTPSLDLSTIVLAGFLPGSDRVAVLFGASPKVALW
jgi:hypothetical protein